MNVKAILAAKKLGGDIVSIEPTANLAAAARLLSAHRIGAVVIHGAGGRLAGILSERDIVRALAEYGPTGLDLPVGQVMTQSLITVGPDRPARDGARLMLNHKIGALPVLDDGHLVGIVTETDIVRAFVHMTAPVTRGRH